MYIITPILIVLIFVLFLLSYHRKKRTIEKLSEMSYSEKSGLLNELCEPYGLTYEFVQDIFRTSTDTWPNELGYGEFYDLTALSRHMVLDCEPVYFNYQGRTWLIEFWKGEYGIHTGARAGIFHADSVLAPMLRPQTIFQAANEQELFPVKLRLLGPSCPFFSVSRKPWGASGFVTGSCMHPEDLTLEVTLTFPDKEMCAAFTRAMSGLGYKSSELLIYQTTVQFYFTAPKAAPLTPSNTLLKSYMLFANSFFCDFYLWITEPFFMTADRLLYLHCTHPFLFKKLFCMGMFKAHRRKKQ